LPKRAVAAKHAFTRSCAAFTKHNKHTPCPSTKPCLYTVRSRFFAVVFALSRPPRKKTRRRGWILKGHEVMVERERSLGDAKSCRRDAKTSHRFAHTVRFEPKYGQSATHRDKDPRTTAEDLQHAHANALENLPCGRQHKRHATQRTARMRRHGFVFVGSAWVRRSVTCVNGSARSGHGGHGGQRGHDGRRAYHSAFGRLVHTCATRCKRLAHEHQPASIALRATVV